MIDLVLSLLAGVVDTFLFKGPSSDRRTFEAYRSTARKYQLGNVDYLPSLREAFKQHSAPGAYTDPDGVALRRWLDSWKAARSPRAARRYANARR